MKSLPQSWVRVALGDITHPIRPRASPQDFPELPFIGMESVEANTTRLLGTTLSTTMKSAAVHFWPRDVLYGRLRPYLNKVHCAKFEGLCSSEFIVLPANDCVNSRYLQYFLNSAGFVSMASRVSTGDRPRVDFNQIRVFPMPLPPLPEQARVAAEIEKHLTRLEVAVAALRRVSSNLERYRATVLGAACEGRLVLTEAELAREEKRDYEPAEALLKRISEDRRAMWEREELSRSQVTGKASERDEWKRKYEEPVTADSNTLPRSPEGWAWASVEELGLVRLGRQRSPKHHTGKNMRPYLRTANVFEARIDTSDVLEMNFTPAEFVTYHLVQDDILLNEGQSLELVGRPAIYGGEVPDACFQNTLVRFRGSRFVLPKFALTVFRSYLRNHRFRRIARWTTNIAHLGAERFAKIEFPLPPFAEQLRIVAEVDRHISLIDDWESTIQRSAARSRRLRQAVLELALDGRLLPQDPSDEPATKLLERIRSGGTTGPLDARRSR